MMSVSSNTREKLKLYKAYLESYLSVITRSRYNTIKVIEPFAGTGWNENEKGSALISIECLHEYSAEERNSNKNFHLILNERDVKKHRTLKSNLDMPEYMEHVETSTHNEPAQSFLDDIANSLRRNPSCHSLIFIDPYGYTQYSLRNINNILNLRNVDCLIFIPTSMVSRFIHTIDNPARDFVLKLGVEPSALDSIRGSNALANLLIPCFKRKSNSPYVYHQLLESTERRNRRFHLFFVTRSVRGAEKFLESRRMIKNQMHLFFQQEVEEFLNEALDEKITNKVLCEKAIVAGFLPSDITDTLKKKEQKREIIVSDPNGIRRGKSLYIKIDPKEKIIHIQKVKK